jgi:hypothetical protein
MIGYGTSLHNFEMRGNAGNGTLNGSGGFRRFVVHHGGLSQAYNSVILIDTEDEATDILFGSGQ